MGEGGERGEDGGGCCEVGREDEDVGTEWLFLPCDKSWCDEHGRV